MDEYSSVPQWTGLDLSQLEDMERGMGSFSDVPFFDESWFEARCRELLEHSHPDLGKEVLDELIDEVLHAYRLAASNGGVTMSQAHDLLRNALCPRVLASLEKTLMTLIKSKVFNPDDQMEVYQDVWLRTSARLLTWRSPTGNSNFPAWAITCTVNAIRSRQRHDGCKKRYLLNPTKELKRVEEDQIEDWRQNEPAFEAQQREVRRRIRQLVRSDKLNAQQQELLALLLKFYKGELSKQEIAQHLSITQSALSNRIQRLFKVLHSLLEWVNN